MQTRELTLLLIVALVFALSGRCTPGSTLQQGRTELYCDASRWFTAQAAANLARSRYPDAKVELQPVTQTEPNGARRSCVQVAVHASLP